jgi:hypothetical protein
VQKGNFSDVGLCAGYLIVCPPPRHSIHSNY